jgi:hypothetical protein
MSSSILLLDRFGKMAKPFFQNDPLTSRYKQKSALVAQRARRKKNAKGDSLRAFQVDGCGLRVNSIPLRAQWHAG